MSCRGEDIPKEVVAFKDDCGNWSRNRRSPATNSQDLAAESLSECESDTVNEIQAAPSDALHVQDCNQTETAVPEENSITMKPGVIADDSHDTKELKESVMMTTSCAQVLQQASAASHTNVVEIDLNDPTIYSGRRLKLSDINKFLNAGPCQPSRDFNFPSTKGRSFNHSWFHCNMPDNTTYRRKWLSYSTSADKIYCIPCIVFSGPRGSDVWTTSGFNDWVNAIRDLKRHACSPEHRAAEIAQIQWLRGMTVGQISDRHRSVVVEDNRKVVECVIDCVRFLTSEMLAFWGNNSNDGKFIGLFRLLAKRDPSAAAYLLKINEAHKAGKKMAVNLISPGNVSTVFKVMKSMVVEKIVKGIESQRKTCLIFDSTQDYSKREASVLLMRYMETDNNGENGISERLLEVFTTGETSGTVLTEHVLQDLQRMKIDLGWIIGQCYDGAGNMRGKYSGMATKIQAHCSKAVYIWCHAHRLNLVVNAVGVCSHDVKNTLGLLEELYVFMCGHKRNDVFMKEQNLTEGRTLQLKRVSTTRWNSSEAAVDTVLSRYSEVLRCLSHLSEPAYDSGTITQATGLKARLQDIRIILSMHILKLVYHIIGPASRSLQGMAIDLAGAAALLSDCTSKFQKLRADSEKQWQILYKDSVDFATAHGIPTEFPSERRKKKKRQDGELAADETLCSEQRMKVETFVTVLDEVLQQLQSRFGEQNVEFMKQLSIFTPAGLLSSSNDNIGVNDIRPICEQYGLSAVDVHAELVDFRCTYRVCCRKSSDCNAGK